MTENIDFILSIILNMLIFEDNLKGMNKTRKKTMNREGISEDNFVHNQCRTSQEDVTIFLLNNTSDKTLVILK